MWLDKGVKYGRSLIVRVMITLSLILLPTTRASAYWFPKSFDDMVSNSEAVVMAKPEESFNARDHLSQTGSKNSQPTTCSLRIDVTAILKAPPHSSLTMDSLRLTIPVSSYLCPGGLVYEKGKNECFFLRRTKLDEWTLLSPHEFDRIVEGRIYVREKNGSIRYTQQPADKQPVYSIWMQTGVSEAPSSLKSVMIDTQTLMRRVRNNK